jgi:pimeloyl-ACP methyl ester carboxylesterase
MLAFRRPAVAIDLPDHGHSSWRTGGPSDARLNALDLAVAVRELGADAKVVVGMSAGGLSAIALAAHAPELVRKLVLVDVTPSVTREQGAAITAFVSGPERFASIDEILEYTIEHNPTRSAPSLRRGVLHNAKRQADGSWVWRYRRAPKGTSFENRSLWDDVAGIRVPIMLLRGNARGTCVDDAAEAELRARHPGAEVHVVDGAGHSIQGDRPLELVHHLEHFLDG